MSNLSEIGIGARKSSREISSLSGDVRNQAIRSIAQNLSDSHTRILNENEKDTELGKKNGLSNASLDRLILTSDRIDLMANDLLKISELPDPIGETMEMKTMPNGMQVGRKRVPLGVIGVIYESRPNVTVDISALCLKSGNAVILRGGSEAFNSNAVLTDIIRESIASVGIPEDAVQGVGDTDRSLVSEMLKMDEFIDLMIPPGGADLVRRVSNEASMPAITGGVGVCHTYIDSSAEVGMSSEIVFNAKVQRPSVCNAMDTVIMHISTVPSHLPVIADNLARAGVEMRCDRRALSALGSRKNLNIVPAKDEDWDTEHLSLVAGVKVVDSLDEAMEHIARHGTGHSEAIVTENYTSAERFIREVDSSAVMVNASTRFNDGGQFGLGAEVAISTNKMHARGPMGLKELTSYKWVVLGMGHIRP